MLMKRMSQVHIINYCATDKNAPAAVTALIRPRLNEFISRGFMYRRFAPPVIEMISFGSGIFQ